MFKHVIANKSGISVDVNHAKGEDAGLVVATRPHKIYTIDTSFFINPTYGREMAQNAAYGGTPLAIHDGTDSVAWTFSEPVGTKWVVDSTDQFHAGTKSLKCDNANVGDIMQVINNVGPGNDIDMTGNYVGLTMWIYVDEDWLAGDSVSLYAHVGGALVGNKIFLEDYFRFDTYDTWHFINIQISDMGIESSSIDAFRFQNEAREGGKSPKFYIDEIDLQQSGTPIDFEVKPDEGTWLYVKAFQTLYVDAITADNADSTMMQLSYDKILDMTPTAGYVFKQYSKGVSVLEARITNLMDLLGQPYSEITNAVSDGTNTMITITNKFPAGLEVLLKAEELDRLVFTIEDNFSELLFFRISLHGFVEQRP
jgi:hypothetical protein